MALSALAEGSCRGNTVYKTVSRFDRRPATGRRCRTCPSSSPATARSPRWAEPGQSAWSDFVAGGVRQGFSGVPYVWKYTPP